MLQFTNCRWLVIVLRSLVAFRHSWRIFNREDKRTSAISNQANAQPETNRLNTFIGLPPDKQDRGELATRRRNSGVLQAHATPTYSSRLTIQFQVVRLSSQGGSFVFLSLARALIDCRPFVAHHAGNVSNFSWTMRAECTDENVIYCK